LPAVVSNNIQNLYNQWNVQSSNIHGDHFTGYEPIYDQLKTFTKQVYDKDPAATIEQVKALYRNINLVPIDYYTEEGLRQALREFKLSDANPVKNNVLGLGNNQGQKINRFMFPNMMTAEPKGRGSNSLRDRFFDDVKLSRAIRICFEFRDGEFLLHPTALRRALELVTGENIQNFKAQNARAITEHLCPVMFGRVYDYSAGYGGRLLGVSSSKMGYQYIGIDPNTETHGNLSYLAQLIEETYGRGHELHCDVSENFQLNDIDLAFSSPPYFNLEKYCDEETQCMVRCKTIDEWFELYVIPTIKNIHQSLNSDGYFATNIADYKSYGNKEYLVVDRWIETATKLGFIHSGTIKMMLNTRPGVGNNKTQGREKWEGIYVFTKN
jgi:hypothetical protein